MKIIKKNNLKSVYKKLIKLLLKEKNINGTKEIKNCIIEIKNPSTQDLNFGCRDISLKYANAELEWYWSGNNSCEDIGKYASMWLRLTDDGKTSNSAYGYILHKKYGRDQLKEIIELLKKDKYSRRAILNISDPRLNKIETKDLQCTIAIHFLIRNDRLEETVYMRSNDVYFGFPYDYIYFVSIGEYVAKQLNLKLGLYTHCATSLHMYEKDFNKFKIKSKNNNIDCEEIIKNNYEAKNNIV